VPPVTLYFSRGTLLLSALVTSNPSITNPIISDMTKLPTSSFDAIQTFKVLTIAQHFILLGYHMVSVAMASEHAKKVSKKNETVSKEKLVICRQWGMELLKSILMTVLFLSMDPLVAFAVYFGTWHSLGATVDELRFLKMSKINPFGANKQTNNNNNSKQHPVNVTFHDLLKFLYYSTPYTSVALLSMSAFYLATMTPSSSSSSSSSTFSQRNNSTVVDNATWLEKTKLWSIFVVSISVLTGPHMWIMGILHGQLQEFGVRIGFGIAGRRDADVAGVVVVGKKTGKMESSKDQAGKTDGENQVEEEGGMRVMKMVGTSAEDVKLLLDPLRAEIWGAKLSNVSVSEDGKPDTLAGWFIVAADRILL
jgi:hypothetical protein